MRPQDENLKCHIAEHAQWISSTLNIWPEFAVDRNSLVGQGAGG
jgi:hypothetical protein